MPTWLGDCVMATPTLRALRQLYPLAHITALMRRELRPILDPCPWLDRIVTIRRKSKSHPKRKPSGGLKLARRLAASKFDTAVLLPNSFRSAMLVRLAGIKRRIGYNRDGRGTLLTDRLLPRVSQGQYVPISAHEYYLGLARYLGAVNPDPATALFTKGRHDDAARAILTKHGWDATSDPSTGCPRRPLVILNPGAAFGGTKMWDPKHYARVADECVQRFNALVAVSGAPSERQILDAVHAGASSRLLDLPSQGIDMTLLKSVIKQASLMVTNDTGPRHIAAAFRVPVVTVYGSTDPAWAQTEFEHEREVHMDVYCRPCQKKRCPLRGTSEELQCLKLIEPDAVMQHVTELFEKTAKERLDAAGQVAAGEGV